MTSSISYSTTRWEYGGKCFLRVRSAPFCTNFIASPIETLRVASLVRFWNTKSGQAASSALFPDSRGSHTHAPHPD